MDDGVAPGIPLGFSSLPYSFPVTLPAGRTCVCGAAPRSGMATLTRNNGKKQSINPNLHALAEREAAAPGLSLPASPHHAVQRR